MNRIKSGCFINFKNLKYLSFWFCNLDRINKYLFEGLNNLEYLDICLRKINSIDSDAFCFFDNLRIINFKCFNTINNLDYILRLKLYDTFAHKLENLNFIGFNYSLIDDLSLYKYSLGLRQETLVLISPADYYSHDIKKDIENIHAFYDKISDLLLIVF